MYARGVGELRAMGAKALAAKDYAEAGKITGLLLKNLDSFKGLGAPAERGASDRKDLAESLRGGSSGLTNNGLAEYRKGNLEKAMAIWADLLAFDPDNAEIKKAVETAKAQLGLLKGTSPGGAKDGSGRGGKNGQGGLRPGYY
jgi:tetratricopeptide (TPR) repeat protein